jgi:hypothetical protein
MYDRFHERTASEERESAATCWECGDTCAELVQAPWTARMLLVGPCCLPPFEEQMENAVTAGELVAQDAEELAVFGCSVRQSLIAASDTLSTMRVLLRSHEAECVHCGCTKKTVVSDRLMVRAGAVCCERQVA